MKFLFLELFYKTLFAPDQASQLIKDLREQDSTKLFFYSLLILLFSSLGISSAQGDFGLIFPIIIFWFILVSSLGLLAWHFRPNDRPLDFGLIFLFCAFAQAPLTLLGLAHLWASSAFPATAPSLLCHIWAICLWGWAISNSIQNGPLKSGFMLATALLLPFVLLICFLFILIMSVAGMIK
ncbi:MAG: hypothetical protein ACK481_00655 [Candidatus Melainabacteria bacterium]